MSSRWTSEGASWLRCLTWHSRGPPNGTGPTFRWGTWCTASLSSPIRTWSPSWCAWTAAAERTAWACSEPGAAHQGVPGTGAQAAGPAERPGKGAGGGVPLRDGGGAEREGVAEGPEHAAHAGPGQPAGELREHDAAAAPGPVPQGGPQRPLTAHSAPRRPQPATAPDGEELIRSGFELEDVWSGDGRGRASPGAPR
ncbi:hypothetical protein COCON_G00101170 [Conger conger]|uniref:Uncharacterized protein n=1 Tax=Conger conger TaxID=82655 RepID=A0A9Q1HYI7_CONCO|nr:hypothetical protein COCON_G00101170 [Conger conger]